MVDPLLNPLIWASKCKLFKGEEATAASFGANAASVGLSGDMAEYSKVHELQLSYL